MESVKLPPELSSKGSLASNWKEWRLQFMKFLEASGAADQPTHRRASLLFSLIGPVGQQVLTKLTPNESSDMETLMNKLNDHFTNKVTEVHTRYIFFSSARQSAETIDQYVETLKLRAKACNFGVLTETLIRDKIVLDMKDKELRKHVLKKSSNPSLNEIIGLWRISEAMGTLAQLSSPKNVPKTVIKTEYRPTSSNIDGDGKSETSSSNCGRCGERHHPKNCPAWGKKCENCGMMNHLAKSCTKPSTTNIEIQNESKTPKYFNPGPIVKNLNKKDVDD